MLHAQRIQTLAETYSAQEFFAVLMWQRRFNEFEGPQVVRESNPCLIGVGDRPHPPGIAQPNLGSRIMSKPLNPALD